MKLQRETPTGGQTGQGEKALQSNVAAILPFRPRTAQHWLQVCSRCNSVCRRPYRAGTVRGPRAELCPAWWINGGMPR
jgi:hypothetical protein